MDKVMELKQLEQESITQYIPSITDSKPPNTNAQETTDTSRSAKGRSVLGSNAS